MQRFFAVVGLVCVTGTGMPSGFADGAGGTRPQHPSPENVVPPQLAIAREAGLTVISFTGRLESAPTAQGPWEEVASATSPYHPEATAARSFYRASEPEPESGGLFSSRSIVPWVVTGPLQTHFDLAFAGLPDGIFPPRREKPYFDGSVQMAGKDIPVSLRVRGNSSLQECPFPKLKFKVSKEARKGTPFEDAREIKIGTHCAEGGRGTIGRLRDERATFREALAYEIMETLGFTAPRVRRARIEFRDTSPTNDFGSTQWRITREAVILEDAEVLAERLGGHALDDVELAALKDANFNEQLITDLECLHALLGNWDYKLSLDGVGLWNTDVIQLSDGKYVPIAGDFDLSSFVTAQVFDRAPRDYHPEWADLDRQAHYDVDQIRTRVKPSIFVAARDRFTQKRGAIESLIEAALIDEAGRANARHHVAAFFEALAD